MAELEDNISLKLLKALKSQTFYNALGLAAIRIIKDRTRHQTDVEGSFFQSYSAGYLKKKEKAGFADPSEVNLTFSRVGGMLASIDHRVSAGLDSVTVYFKDPVKEKIAEYHNIQGAGKGKVIRRFWGIKMRSEKDKLAALGFNQLSKIFKNL